MEYLLGLICVLSAVTVVGHGMWLVLATVFKELAGATKHREYCPLCGMVNPPNYLLCQRCGVLRSSTRASEMRDLGIFELQLERFHETKEIDEATFAQLQERILRRRRQLLGAEIMVPPAAKPVEALPVPPAEPPPALAAVPAQPAPLEPPFVAPPAAESPPRPPRRNLVQMLAGFMEERNILWGELVGGLLIVGCSIALVISLWRTLEQIPYFPFFIFVAITAALYGAGLYTLRRWKLASTSRGLLVIATLLVPLNFLAMASLSRGEASWVPLRMAAEAAAISVFLGLLTQAARLLVPRGRWLLTCSVLGVAAGELLFPRLLTDAAPPWLFVLLGLAPTLIYVTTALMLTFHLTRPSPVDAERARELLAFLGMTAFALAVNVGLLVHHGDDLQTALQRIAPLVTLMSVPILIIGLVVHHGLERTAGEGALRTAGTAIALTGMTCMLLAVALAWPQPYALLVVCLVNLAVMTATALRYRLPVGHVPAVACAVLAYLVGYHLVWNHLAEPYGASLRRAVFSPATGTALAALVGLFAFAAEILVRRERRTDGIVYAAAGGITALFSLILLAVTGPAEPLQISLVYALYGVGVIAVNCRWRLPHLSHLGSVLLLGCLIYAANGDLAGRDLPRPLLLALVTHATLMTVASSAIPAWRALPEPATLFARPWRQTAFVSSLAALPLLLHYAWDDIALLAGCALAVALVWLALAWIEEWPRLFTAFQAMLALAVLDGITAWLADQSWVARQPVNLWQPWSLHAYGIGLVLLALAWGAVRLATRTNAVVQRLLHPGWLMVDQAILAILVAGQLILAVGTIVPHVAAELLPVDASLQVAQQASAAGGWLLLALTTVALALAFLERGDTAYLVGVLLTAATVPWLIAGLFVESIAAASAIRWGWSFCFLATSALLWCRQSLLKRFAQWHIPWGKERASVGEVMALLIALTAAPLLALTLFQTLLVLAGQAPLGPLPDSWFGEMGSRPSFLGPLLLLALGLLGHALRENLPGYGLAAGLVVNLAVTLGYSLGVIQGGGSLGELEGIRLLQLFTITAAGWACGWLALRQRRYPAAAAAAIPPPMMAQVFLGVAGQFTLFLLAATKLFFRPGEPWRGLEALGDGWGVAALAVSMAALFWLERQRGRTTPVPAIGVVGLTASALIACIAMRWDSGNWLAYHVLIAGWTLTAWVILWRAARDLPAGRTSPLGVSPWLQTAAALVVLFAVRGGASDPDRPYWPAGTTLAIGLLAAFVAVGWQRVDWIYLATLLTNLSGFLVWRSRPQRTGADFVYLQIICLGLASTAWSLLRLVGRPPAWPEKWRASVPAAQAGSVVALALTAGMAALGTLQAWGLAPPMAGGPLAWTAWVATMAAIALCLWDLSAVAAAPGLYVAGLAGMALAWHEAGLAPVELGWWAGLTLAGYVALTAAITWTIHRWPQLRQQARLPETVTSVRLVPMQVVVSSVALVLSLWMSLDFAALADRLAGSLAAVLIAAAGIALAATEERDRRTLQIATLLVAIIAVVEFGWAWLDPADPNLVIDRTILLMLVLAAATAFFTLAPGRLLPRTQDWAERGQRLALFTGSATCFALLLVLLQEMLLYQPPIKRAPLAMAAVVSVLATQMGSIALGLTLAVKPGADPWRLSERRRRGYVYAVELFLVLLVLHLRLTVPQLFHPDAGKYWTFIVMGIAFLGVGLSAWFQRRGLTILAEPLARTGVFLPLLPLLAFWLRPPLEWREAAMGTVPGTVPILDLLYRIEQNFGKYAALWMLLSLLYAWLATTRRSFRFAVGAALAANFGLWCLLYQYGVAFLVHPQTWFIPLAVILLVSEQLNRDRLSRPQSLALRYAALCMIYVSSSADMFIAGLGNSVLLPMVLAVLAVLGVLIGILLRVRAYLFLGTAFLLVDIVSMIWHAAIDRQQTWILWSSGIALGVAVLALFALFEKRRHEVLLVMEDLQRWD